MQLNSLSSVGIATQVWVQATRTLTNPTGVFSDATRTLTGLINAGALISAINTQINASATADLRPASGHLRDATIAVQPTAANTLEIDLYDGATLRKGNIIAANSSQIIEVNGTNTVGLALKNNDGATGAFYTMTGIDWA